MKFLKDIARGFGFSRKEAEFKTPEVTTPPKVEAPPSPEKHEEPAHETATDGGEWAPDPSEWRRPFRAGPDDNTIESHHEDPEHFRAFVRLENASMDLRGLFRDMELWTEEGRKPLPGDVFELTPEEREEQGEPTAFEKELRIQREKRFPSGTQDAISWLNRGSKTRTEKMLQEGRTPETIREEQMKGFDDLLKIVLSEIQISWRDWRGFLKAQQSAEAHSSEKSGFRVHSADVSSMKDIQTLIETAPATKDRGVILSWLNQLQQSMETLTRESYLWADFVAVGLDRERSSFEEKRQEQEVQKIWEKYKGRFPIFEVNKYVRALEALLFNYFDIDRDDYDAWRNIEYYKYGKAYGEENGYRVSDRHFLMDMMQHWAEEETDPSEKERLYGLIEEERQAIEKQYGKPKLQELRRVK